MRISVKGKYAILGVLYLFEHRNNEVVSLASISKDLNISKIYLEQVFSVLKRGNLVISFRGKHGGYKLNNKIKNISLLDILKLTESNLFENKVISNNLDEIEIITNRVLSIIDETIKNSLSKITIEELSETLNNKPFMYYI